MPKLSASNACMLVTFSMSALSMKRDSFEKQFPRVYKVHGTHILSPPSKFWSKIFPHFKNLIWPLGPLGKGLKIKLIIFVEFSANWGGYPNP